MDNLIKQVRLIKYSRYKPLTVIAHKCLMELQVVACGFCFLPFFSEFLRESLGRCSFFQSATVVGLLHLDELPNIDGTVVHVVLNHKALIDMPHSP